MGLPVTGFNGGARANDAVLFQNARAESYWCLREWFEQGLIDIDPNDEELAAQLCSIKWEVDSRGRINVERKEDMPCRGLPSPDRADGVAMALVQFEQVVYVEAHTRGRLISDGILNMEW
jgi:hypothetical protein